MLRDYIYTPGATNSVLSSGSKKSIFNLFSQKTQNGSLTIDIIVKGRNREELQRNCDSITGLFSGLAEVRMDGYLFRLALSQIGATAKLGMKAALVSITAAATKHLPKVEFTGKKVFCRSQVPETDCILSAEAGESGNDYILGSVTFNSVAAGDKLIVDGIKCKILKNGIPCASECTFSRFQTLKPGNNTIACADTPTITYYPTFY